MKIFNQWRTNFASGFVLLSFYWFGDFWGICICNFTFEFPTNRIAREIHKEME